jgi:hypothetical protein
MNETQTEKFESWVKLELMGRKVIIGKATEATLAGASLLRIDVPAAGDQVAYTQFYGPSAIYCITPITEEMAMRAGPRINSAPISEWYFRPEPIQLEGPDGQADGRVEGDSFDNEEEDAES